jgi:hypothetical protein
MKPTCEELIKTVRRLSGKTINAMERLELSMPSNSPLHKEVVDALNAYQHTEALFEGIYWHLLPQGRE